jgi:multidrug efflux pump subunit AcrB
MQGSYPIVPTNAVVKNIQDLAAVPLRVQADRAVYLRDVGDVSDGTDLVTSIALVNGRRTVYMPVTKRADASTLSVVDLVKVNLPKFKAACPDDIDVSFEFDQSFWIQRAIRDLFKEGILGAALTGLMVLLFLRDFRGAVVVILNIPISISAALLGLWVGGQTINLMTLGGLALAVGILVDEATVEMENLHAHLARGAGVARAAVDASLETALPRLLAMLCVVAVFVPALFMDGAARALFVPLSLSVGLSMFCSYLLSSTLLPVLNVWWAGIRKGHNPAFLAAGYRRAGAGSRVFSGVVGASTKLRVLLVPLYVGACSAVVVLLAPGVASEIFPKVDAGQIQLRFRAEPGTPVEVTEKIARRILDVLAEEAGQDQVRMTMGLVGVHASNYPVNLIHQWNSGPEEGVLQVQLVDGTRVRVADLREKLRARLGRDLPGVRVSFEPADIVSRVMALGTSTPIEVAVSGKDFGATRAHAHRILERMSALKELRDVQISQSLDYPSVNVTVDRERAGLLGVRMVDATRSLVAATASSRFTVPNYWADPKSGVSYSLQVQVPQGQMKGAEDLLNLPVSAGTGKAALLRNFATVSEGTIVGQYDRYNMARTVSVMANIESVALGRAAGLVEKVLADLPPPVGVQVAVRGQIPLLRELETGLKKGLGVAVLVILLLLTANFQSMRLSLVVLVSVPAVLAGVVLCLRCFGITFNLQSFMGTVMAVGVSVSNAILLVSFAARAQKAGASRVDAAIQGATGRVRPILMTSLAMIAGMIPMAVGGTFSEPLARAVIAGLLFSTVSTLVILPAAYALVAGKSPSRASLDPDDPECCLPQEARRVAEGGSIPPV